MCRLFVIAGLFLVFRQLPPVGVAVDLVLQLLPERLRGRRLLGVRGDGVGHIRAVGGIDSVSLRRGQVYTLGRRGLYLGRVRRHDGRRNVLEIRAVAVSVTVPAAVSETVSVLPSSLNVTPSFPLTVHAMVLLEAFSGATVARLLKS